MADKVYIELGKRLREARKDAGYSQQDMGDFLNMSDVNFGSFERGSRQISLTYLIEASKILGRSVSWFLGLDTGLTEEEDQVLTWWRNSDEDQRKVVRKILK